MPDKAHKSRFKGFFSEHSRLLKFLCFFILLGIIAALMQPIILKLIHSNPDLDDTYEFVRGQLHKQSMLWLFIVCIIGTLFFVALPIDFFFLYYIMSGANPVLSVVAAFGGVMVGRSFDFWFGRLFHEYTKKHIIKNKAKKFRQKLADLGNWVLVFGNYIPFFPMEAFVVFMGTTNYKYRKFLIYQGLGKLTKFIIIIILVKLLVPPDALVSFNFADMIKSITKDLV